jgi:hypothetical protein
LNGCFAVAAPLACILQCDPIARYWDSTISGKCVDPGAYTISTSPIVLGSDFLILLMPSWILHDVTMPLGRKSMMIAFLSVGVAVTIVGAVRTSVLVKVFVIREVVRDPTYGVSYTLSNIESGLAIIGTCGPTIKYILGLCFPALKAADQSSNRNHVYPPSGGSLGKRCSRRQHKSNETNGMVGEADEIDLTNTIMKTVSWRVDTAQPDSTSVRDERISMPRNML